MKGGIEKLAGQLGELAANNAMMAYENWAMGMDSPIERLLFIGMYSFVETAEIEIAPLSSVEIVDGPVDQTIHPMALERIARRGTMLLQMQHKVLDWKADFVLSCPSISNKIVIVECDGHEFHERTKEQAARDRARDRSAQAAGHMMLRYTGSEIYRDPLGCARSAVKALSDFIHDDWLKDL